MFRRAPARPCYALSSSDHTAIITNGARPSRQRAATDAENSFMAKCSKCGASVPEQKAFCPECGTPTSEQGAERKQPAPDFGATVIVPPSQWAKGAPPPPPTAGGA